MTCSIATVGPRFREVNKHIPHDWAMTGETDSVPQLLCLGKPPSVSFATAIQIVSTHHPSHRGLIMLEHGSESAGFDEPHLARSETVILSSREGVFMGGGGSSRCVFSRITSDLGNSDMFVLFAVGLDKMLQMMECNC